jgi:hypothetical protein
MAYSQYFKIYSEEKAVLLLIASKFSIYLTLLLSLLLIDKAPRHDDICRSGLMPTWIVNLGIIWKGVVSFTPRPLKPIGDLALRC